MFHADTILNGKRRVPSTSSESSSSVFQRLNALHEILRRLRDDLPGLSRTLCLDSAEQDADWITILDTKLLPQTDPDYPLLIAICGGGSSGKSTLFNSLVGKSISVVGGTAGLSRRVLVAAHPELIANTVFMSDLFAPFGCVPTPLSDPNELTTPGNPVYVADDAVPTNVVLIDTPDFDTGHDDTYANRHVVKPVLQAANILVYIFTNATYRNLANTSFIKNVLTETGARKAVLVYRTYDNYTTPEVQQHCLTVAQNLYGDAHSAYVSGSYRTSDINAIAESRSYMQLKPIAPTTLCFSDYVSQLDPRQLRAEELQRILDDFIQKTKATRADVRLALDNLTLYSKMLQLVESHYATTALQRVPLGQIMQRMVQLWYETSPTSLKRIRCVGKFFGLPISLVLKAGKYVHKKFTGEESQPASEPPYKNDLLAAANRLRCDLLSDMLSATTTHSDDNGKLIIELARSIAQRTNAGKAHRPQVESLIQQPGAYNVRVHAHPALQEARNTLRNMDEDRLMADLMTLGKDFEILPEVIDKELQQAILDFRKNMSLGKRLREVMFASLSTLPPIIAVTYVLCTGEPVSGTGLLVKLQNLFGSGHAAAGLFGLNDLYAVIALPISTGLDAADRKQLEQLLQPAYSKWFALRVRKVRDVFCTHITNSILQRAQDLEKEAQQRLSSLTQFEELCNTPDSTS